MLIGQFTDTYPPSLDGVGRVALNYCRTLQAMSSSVYYIAPASPRPAGECNVPVLLQKSLPIPGEPFRIGLPWIDSRYRHQLDALPFDLVHCHSPFSAGAQALRVGHRLGVPVVSTFHSKYRQDFYDKTHSNILTDMIVKRIVAFYEHCDAVWTVSESTADVLREYGFHGSITVMPNGTDIEEPDEQAEARAEQLLPPQDECLTLLFVGQHSYKKNLHGILGACSLLKKRGVPFRLVTVGDGPDMKAIRHEAAALGIAEECRFLGFLADRGTVLAIHRRADLLVFPSVYDNAPMVVREAAAMETPALVVRGSCSAEGIEDGVNGFLCDAPSAEAVADGILKAIPGLRSAGTAARMTIPVPWKTVMEKVITEYDRLIALRRTV